MESLNIFSRPCQSFLICDFSNKDFSVFILVNLFLPSSECMDGAGQDVGNMTFSLLKNISCFWCSGFELRILDILTPWHWPISTLQASLCISEFVKFTRHHRYCSEHTVSINNSLFCHCRMHLEQGRRNQEREGSFSFVKADGVRIAPVGLWGNRFSHLFPLVWCLTLDSEVYCAQVPFHDLVSCHLVIRNLHCWDPLGERLIMGGQGWTWYCCLSVLVHRERKLAVRLKRLEHHQQPLWRRKDSCFY